MKMIVGLGNPGKKYENTRHNMGFRVLDLLAEEACIRIHVNRSRALTGMGLLGGEKVLLVKPLTYMNLSGEAVAPLAAWYRIPPEDILVVCDDVNLPLGRIRVRRSGSAGGHNGLENLILRLGSNGFPRVRCGAGMKPAEWDLVDYVLARYTPEEEKEAEAEYRLAADAVLAYLTEGPAEAMNRYNRDPEKEAARQKAKAEREAAWAEKEAREAADAPAAGHVPEE